MAQIVKFTYPKGKTFIGFCPDLNGDDFSGFDWATFRAELATLPVHQQVDYTVRRQVLWENDTDSSVQPFSAGRKQSVTTTLTIQISDITCARINQNSVLILAVGGLVWMDVDRVGFISAQKALTSSMGLSGRLLSCLTDLKQFLK